MPYNINAPINITNRKTHVINKNGATINLKIMFPIVFMAIRLDGKQ